MTKLKYFPTYNFLDSTIEPVLYDHPFYLFNMNTEKKSF